MSIGLSLSIWCLSMQNWLDVATSYISNQEFANDVPHYNPHELDYSGASASKSGTVLGSKNKFDKKSTQNS